MRLNPCNRAVSTSPADSRAIGLRLGQQLRQWLAQEPERLRLGPALANRMLDALGADDTLSGPIRDLCRRPQLMQVLHGQGAQQQAALDSLHRQLAQTYAPAVLNQFEALLEAATGLSVAPVAAVQDAEPVAPPAADVATQRRQVARAARPPLAPLVHAIGPGTALALSATLVFSWLAQELDRQLFDGWGWSGGVVLVLVLGLIQALAIGPMPRLPLAWSLSSQQATEPSQAWRWVGAIWVHTNRAEAVVHLLLLLILLGASPLPLSQVLLRYGLTGLACLIPAVVLANQLGIHRRWSGASGAISALIALAAGLSLLKWQPMAFTTPLFSIPAWVLLLAYSALELSWQLPASGEDDNRGTPLGRLACSPWAWGTLLGLGWAMVTWGQQLISRVGPNS